MAQALLIPGRQPDEKFVWFVPNVLTPEECQSWIQDAERKGFQPASLLADGQTKNPHRTNDRLLLFDSAKAALLTERLKPYLPVEMGKNWHLVGLNERLSFLRYRSQEHYGRHVDVPYEDEAKGWRSFIFFT